MLIFLYSWFYKWGYFDNFWSCHLYNSENIYSPVFLLKNIDGHVKNESSINISHQGISFLNSSRKVTFLGQYRHLKMSFLWNQTLTKFPPASNTYRTHTLMDWNWYHLFMTSVVSCEILNVHLTFNHPLNLDKIVSMRALEIKLSIWRAFWKITACLPPSP